MHFSSNRLVRNAFLYMRLYYIRKCLKTWRSDYTPYD